MIKAIQPIAPAEYHPALDNPAVARCHEAMERALKAATIDGEVLPFAYIDAYQAYREAMPPVSDYQNICDFIVCATYGMLIGAIQHASGSKFLSAARIALGAINSQARVQEKEGKIHTA
jgi:hypothetical protein